MPDELSLNALVSITENTRLNSVGARTHSCLNPLITWNSSKLQPNFAKIFNYPSLLTELNALVRSKNVINRSCCCSIQHYKSKFSKNNQHTKQQYNNSKINEINIFEVENAIKKLKTNKSPEEDIFSEELKLLGTTMKKTLTAAVNKEL